MRNGNWTIQLNQIKQTTEFRWKNSHTFCFVERKTEQKGSFSLSLFFLFEFQFYSVCLLFNVFRLNMKIGVGEDEWMFGSFIYPAKKVFLVPLHFLCTSKGLRKEFLTFSMKSSHPCIDKGLLKASYLKSLGKYHI